MNNLLNILFLTTFLSGIFSQDNIALDSKAAYIIAQSPWGNFKYFKNAIDKHEETDPAGFQKLAQQLTTSEIGDDTTTRFAMNGLARYFSDMEHHKSSTFTENDKAVATFVNMVRSANLPDEQKLLLYREVMPLATSGENKKSVISSIGNLKTFLSLVYLEQFLEDNELKDVAANSIMKIALPTDNQKNGFSGKIVRHVLERALENLADGGSQYDKVNIKNHLEKMPEGEGFVSMFNGENLDGWQGMLLNGNPIKIAQLSAADRTKAQEEANRKMLENWSVKDGQIIFNGKGGNLVSTKVYRDFEMIVDWRIDKRGDSGIYLRGTPQVQIWDTSPGGEGEHIGSGGLYNNNPDNIRNPSKVADNPINDWNTFKIKMIGENVTIYLNGQIVVNSVRMDNFWDRSIPIFEKGTLELQAHGDELAFRNIYVREINSN